MKQFLLAIALLVAPVAASANDACAFVYFMAAKRDLHLTCNYAGNSTKGYDYHVKYIRSQLTATQDVLVIVIGVRYADKDVPTKSNGVKITYTDGDFYIKMSDVRHCVDDYDTDADIAQCVLPRLNKM